MKQVQILGIIAVVALVCAVPFVAEATPPSDIPFTPGARSANAVSNQVIIDWNVHTQDASGTHSPPRRARTFAMVSIAVHDALNGIENKYARYASSASDPLASPVAAAAKAAHDVLVALFPAQQADLDAKLATSLGAIHDQDALARGVALGQAAACGPAGASRQRRLQRRHSLHVDVPSRTLAPDTPGVRARPRARLGQRDAVRDELRHPVPVCCAVCARQRGVHG